METVKRHPVFQYSAENIERLSPFGLLSSNFACENGVPLKALEVLLILHFNIPRKYIVKPRLLFCTFNINGSHFKIILFFCSFIKCTEINTHTHTHMRTRIVNIYYLSMKATRH